MLKTAKYDWRYGWYRVKTTLLTAAVVSALLGLLLGLLGAEVRVGAEGAGFFGEGHESLVMISSLVWAAVMTALLVLTVDVIFRNFSHRMFGAEGLLTHTLPVHTWQLLLGKALGTWAFGVFMVFVAFAGVLLVLVFTVTGTGAVPELLTVAVHLLPKLGAYHFRQLAVGAGYGLYAVAAFLAWSFFLVVQLQFVFIAARQFGRFHVVGGFVVLFLLAELEGQANRILPLGFVVVLLFAAACFFGSRWLLRRRLSV